MNNQQILINIDFTTGNELPFSKAMQALEMGWNFETNLTCFFQPQNLGCVIRKNDGSYLSVEEIMQNDGRYTPKEIREAHNLEKMFIAGKFDGCYQKPSD